RSWLAGTTAPPPAASAPSSARAEHAASFAQRGEAERRPSDWLFAGPVVGEPVEPAPGAERVRFGELRLLGQLLATYLLVEGKQDLLLVDQHAAHERVLYEQLRAAWLARGVE